MADPITNLIEKGRAEFSDFDGRSAYVVALAANADDLRQAIAAFPDGHRVVAALADDPDEAERILGQRGTQLGMALGEFAATRTAKPAEAAPAAPAAPVPEPDTFDPAMGMREYVAAQDKRAAQRRAAATTLPANRDLSDPKMPMGDWIKVRDAQWVERQAARRAR